MNLLLLHPTPEVEECASRLRAGHGHNVVQLADSDALPLALKRGSASALMVASAGFQDFTDLRDLLYQCNDHSLPVMLILRDLFELRHLDADSRAAVADFVIEPTSAEVMSERMKLVIDRRPMSKKIVAADLEVTRALTSRVIKAQEAERHFLSRELHDGVGQIMLVHYMEAEWLVNSAGSGPLREAAERLCGSLGKTLEMVRDLAMELRPPVIDDLGVSSALESLVKRRSKRSKIPFQWLDDSDGVRIPTDISVGLYRIAQEAIDNAVRHSQANLILVKLLESGTSLILAIEDDGVGFDPNDGLAHHHLGLLSMRERAQSIGGRMAIESVPNQGTQVNVVVPDILESPPE